MSLEVTLSFHDVKRLEVRRTLESLIELYKTLDYELSDLKVGRSPRKEFINHGTHLEGAIPHALSMKRLWFSAKNHENSLDLFVAVDWSEQDSEKPFLWTITDQIQLFTGSDFRPEVDRSVYQNAIVTLGKGLYKITSPTFGLIDAGEPGIGPRDKEIDSVELPRLYWINFLGPKYVEKVGREKLLHIPVGSTEELVDGGILYYLDRDLIGPNVTDKNREQMLRYFGL